MNAESIVTVSAAVVALVQLAKWAGLRESYGPLAVLTFSVLGVTVYVIGGDSWPPGRTDTWPIFAASIAVATSAAGVFGFTRAAVGAVTNASAPPANGAGSQPVEQGDAADPVYPILHENCMRLAGQTSIMPVAGSSLSVTGDLASCLTCERPITRILCKRRQWIAETDEAA